jgi:OOP family OmpA-OmpF porin
MNGPVRESVLGLSVCLVVLAVAPSAVGQNAGFAIDRFEPAARGSDWFAADSLDLRGNGRLLVGATGDFAEKPLVLYAPNGDEQRAVIQNQFFAHIGADLLLGNRLRVGVNIPIAVFQSGDPATIGSTTYVSNEATTLGDLRAAVDLRIVGECHSPIELALGVAAYLPTGSQAAFTGDGNLRLAPRATFAGQAAAIVYAIQAGILYRANSSRFAGAAIGSDTFVSAALGLRVADDRLVLGPELYGSSSISSGTAFLARRSSPFEVLFGAHYLVTRAARVGAGFGPGLTRGIGAPEFRGLVALEWVPIPEQIAPRAPPADPDRDQDRVLTADDACPDVPGVKTDDPKTNGCPGPKDRDRDGIVDSDEHCPDEVGVKTADPLTNGCPEPEDRDHDSVLDVNDACPDAAGVSSDDPKTNGCPPPADRDRDGVPDARDACPEVAGPAHEEPEKNGCPDARVESGQIKILERVEFENDSATLRPESDHVLRAVLEMLSGHPELGNLEIRGYTDNHGAAGYNKHLSEQRAAAVLEWLSDHGVQRSRLSARGFGLERPIDTNDTSVGRQNNRRVEFHLLDRSGKDVETP